MQTKWQNIKYFGCNLDTFSSVSRFKSNISPEFGAIPNLKSALLTVVIAKEMYCIFGSQNLGDCIFIIGCFLDINDKTIKINFANICPLHLFIHSWRNVFVPFWIITLFRCCGLFLANRNSSLHFYHVYNITFFRYRTVYF